MKITENKLLSGYHGVCNDGITAQSIINGEKIWWTYRTPNNDGYGAHVDNERGAYIQLENNRFGKIKLAKRLTKKQIANANKFKTDCEKLWGDKI